MVKVFYWAAFLGEHELVFLFIRGIGVSPFLKAYRGCSAVTACVIGHQVELLKMLTQGCSLYEDDEETIENKNCKYCLVGDGARKAFQKSLECKDRFGNNTMHYAVDIHDESIRGKTMKVLLDNHVGDIDKQNHHGLEPVQMYHE